MEKHLNISREILNSLIMRGMFGVGFALTKRYIAEEFIKRGVGQPEGGVPAVMKALQNEYPLLIRSNAGYYFPASRIEVRIYARRKAAAAARLRKRAEQLADASIWAAMKAKQAELRTNNSVTK